jgi:glycerate kinase
MRVLVAPDSYGGTLTAADAAAAIADGWRRRRPSDEVVVLPVADGGPGTVSALAGLGSVRVADVEGPLGQWVAASWLLIGDTAVVESAAACGRDLGSDPLGATTAGVGELVCAVLDADVRRVVVGVGGTASTDGGAGLAQALGVWLLDARGHPLEPGGGALGGLASVARDDVDPRLASVTVEVAADVDNPLLGPEGAAYGYAPQKGATAEQVALLDAGLAHYASVVGLPDGPFLGAGGGLAYGLAAFCGGVARPGAEAVLDLLGFAGAAARADVVVTGEGTFDWQSLRGKAPLAVARAAAAEGMPCLLLAGQVSAGRRELAAAGIDAAYATADLAGSVEESLAAPAEWLTELASHVAGEWSR